MVEVGLRSGIRSNKFIMISFAVRFGLNQVYDSPSFTKLTHFLLRDNFLLRS